MNRQVTAKHHMADLRQTDLVPGTPGSRIALVWPLTREVVSLSKRYDVERRLQRDVADLVRRKG